MGVQRHSCYANCWSLDERFLKTFFFPCFWRGFFAIGCVRSPDRERQRDRKREITPQRGWSRRNAFSSILRILGTHAHSPDVSFKPPGPGREPQSTTWESSDIAITLTAGPVRRLRYFQKIELFLLFLLFCLKKICIYFF